MKSSDLKTGHIVILNNGDRLIVIRDFYMRGKYRDILYDGFKNYWDSISSYDEYMRCKYDENRDIKKVLEVSSPFDYKWTISSKEEVIWERSEDDINWARIEVDTPIWVKKSKDSEWIPRYFAKYEDGKVWAWTFGATSYTIDSCNSWKYAKLRKEN